MKRCAWVPAGDPLYVAYHDEEWGVPSRDERHLFELLILEGAQAGLSWSTILRKREGYRRAFAGFEPKRVARLDPERLLAAETVSGTGLKPASKRRSARSSPVPEALSIVRNRLKVEAAIANARAWLELDEPVELLWSFVGGEPIRNSRRTLSQVPAETEESRTMSKELKRRGFRFVGPTICYAFMQACGLVNDHTTDCFRYGQV